MTSRLAQPHAARQLEMGLAFVFGRVRFGCLLWPASKVGSSALSPLREAASPPQTRAGPLAHSLVSAVFCFRSRYLRSSSSLSRQTREIAATEPRAIPCNGTRSLCIFFNAS
jgi:hypothetical protein